MPRSSRSRSPAPNDAAVPVDSALLAKAYRKVMDGKDLTRTEREAIRRHEKQKEERLRWQFYRNIPQKHWRQMSGRQAKVINEQAEHWIVVAWALQLATHTAKPSLVLGTGVAERNE